MGGVLAFGGRARPHECRDHRLGRDCGQSGRRLHGDWHRVSFSLEPAQHGANCAGFGTYDILFLEDPLPAVYPDEIKLLGQRTTIPIVGSELLLTRWQLREWMEKHVASILMTDPLWNGGIAETRKIAAMAEAFGLPLVLHNLAGPIGHAVNMHLGSHIPNLFFVESARALYRVLFFDPQRLRPGSGGWLLYRAGRPRAGRQPEPVSLPARRSHSGAFVRRGIGRRTPRDGGSLGGGGNPLSCSFCKDASFCSREVSISRG